MKITKQMMKGLEAKQIVVINYNGWMTTGEIKLLRSKDRIELRLLNIHPLINSLYNNNGKSYERTFVYGDHYCGDVYTGDQIPKEFDHLFEKLEEYTKLSDNQVSDIILEMNRNISKFREQMGFNE